MDTAIAKKEPAAHMAPLAVEHIPVAAIAESPTNPRKKFDKAGLDELAASIKVQGVLSPVLVRPAAKNGAVGIKYELVAGARRWRASRIAGLAHVPALVRPLTDVEVLEIQITENLQREDLDPLEEADGYKQLMALKKINADQLGELIGKSRAYVYTRTKLNDLCPEGRAALQEGKLDASRALLIARIGHHDTQRQALKDCFDTRRYGRGGGEPLSYRDLHEHIQDNYMLRLTQAPFDPKDANLVAKAGACTVCPKLSGNQRDLFGDIKNADVCTDSKCFANKRTVHWANVRKTAESKGQTVIAGAEAKRIFPYEHGDAQAGYQSLDKTCYDDPKQRKVREVVGNDSDAIELVQHPRTGAIVKVVKSSAVTAALNKKGIKTHMQKVAKASGQTGGMSSSAPSAATLEKRQREEEVEELLRMQLTRAIHDKHPDKLNRGHMLMLAHYFTSFDADVAGVAKLNGWNTSGAMEQRLKALTPAKLTGVLLDLYISDRMDTSGNDVLDDFANLYKIDAKAIDKKIRADFARLDAEKKAKEAAIDKKAAKKVKTAAKPMKQAKSPASKTAAKGKKK